MDFTILIPSRNRASLLDRAIRSVLRQSHDSYEILVVNDGSDREQHQEYQLLERQFAGQTRFVHLDRVSAPHGKSRALNIGLSQARGEYVGFLDDDDYWISSDHLRNVKEVVASSDRAISVFLSNQQAGGYGVVRTDLWLAGLARYLARAATPYRSGMYLVTPQLLLQQSGFCHMNTILAKRQLVLDIGGFDETLRYEEDRDFYLRLIDRVEVMLYCPIVTSHHTIPDPAKRENISTRLSEVEKRLIQLASFNKVSIFASRPEVRARARLGKRYVLKDLAMALYRKRDFVAAFYFAREALLIGFTWRWLLYSGWLGTRVLTARRLRDPGTGV